MVRGLIGKKLGMTQIFDKNGNVVPVTVVEAGPCVVVEVKNNGAKVCLGYQPAKEKHVRRPQQGFFKKIGVAPLRMLREFTTSGEGEYKVGQEIKVNIFKPGDYVEVSGVSIGKGFQGGMKRWHWGGGPAGHGSMHHRRVGAIGACADPSRTFKGTHMPGQMGAKKVTVQGLHVMDIDVDKNLLLVKGAVPGAKNALVTINRSLKKAFKSLDEEPKFVARKINPMKQSKAKAKGKK